LLVVTTRRASCNTILCSNPASIPNENQQLNKRENRTKAKCINQTCKDASPSSAQEDLATELHHSQYNFEQICGRTVLTSHHTAIKHQWQAAVSMTQYKPSILLHMQRHVCHDGS
jgi:hypothetical protein